MVIGAYISDGWRPQVLGRFGSVSQAVRLLCPPPTYYVLINRNGTVTQETRVQRAGILLSPEERRSLEQDQQVTFQRGPKLFTISLTNESENLYVNDLELQPGVPEQEAHPASTATADEHGLGNHSGSAAYAPSAIRDPRNGARTNGTRAVPFTR